MTRVVIADDGSLRRNVISLALGGLILALLDSIPFVGWVINAITLFIGLGAILLIVQTRAEAAREAAPSKRYIAVQAPPLPRRADSDRMLIPPPPPIDTTSEPVGMDNLPDGFHWWDD